MTGIASRLRACPQWARPLLRLAAGVLLAAFLFWGWLSLAECPDPLAGKSFSTVVFDRDGGLIRVALTDDDKYRIRMPLSEVPPEALQAVVAYEDRWFWHHPGVNPFSIMRAAAGTVFGHRRLGASTLTMQVARLAYRLRTNTVGGKLRQMYLALLLERHFSKERILEAYFNLAPYGGNIEGLAAAARVYFHKSPAALSLSESEALMLVPQNPAARRPSEANSAFHEAAHRYWHHRRTESAPLRVHSERSLPFEVPHLSQEIVQGPMRGRAVHTFISRPQQKMLEERLRRFSRRGDRFGLKNAAAMLLHWPTMRVTALAGSADFLNSSISGQIDGTRAKRSPGSTLKPLIYALALQQGLIHPQSVLLDTPKSFAGYDPENFDRSFRGPLPAHEALRSSRNVPALFLANRLVRPDLYGLLQSAGVPLDYSREHYGLALALGGAEISMRDLVRLYAMLANGGVLRDLALFEEQAASAPRQLLTPEAGFVVLSMLGDDQAGNSVPGADGTQVRMRVKTGTSNGFRDAWACGIIGEYVLAVWVGNFDNTANPLLVGAQAALPLWREISRALAALEPLRDHFEQAPGTLNVERIEVCRQTGDLDTSLCSDRTRTWFIPGVSPVKPSGVYRRIDIVIESGLRACMPEQGRTQSIVWEVWPSDLERMFALAGIVKPPPPEFEPACRPEPVPGRKLQIQLPKKGLVFYASLASGAKTEVALQAESDSAAGKLSWFVDGSFVGACAPGQTISVKVAPGRYHVLVSDESRVTASRVITVKAVP